MIADNEKNVEKISLVIGAKYFGRALLLIIPLSMASCGGGLVGGVLLIADQKHILIQAMGCLLILFGLTSVIWLNRIFERMMKIPARKALKKLISFERAAADLAISIAGNNCYYNAAYNGAIAVDAHSKKMAIAVGQFKKESGHAFEEIVLTPGEVTDWSAIKGGATFQSVANAGPFTTLAVRRGNLQELAHQGANTGLLLRTTNLSYTEIIINLEFDEAKAWVMVLDKFNKGNLEVPSRPTVYPFV